ncbi:putative defense protein Hdd11-like [Symphorus nematophorus]
MGFVGGYPCGAPAGACEDMIPHHTGVPQPSPAPYILLTNNRTFQPGKPITVFWVNVRSITLAREKPDLSLSTGASAGMAEEKPLLVLGIRFLMLQVLG